ncbi:MAG: bifunctional diguanylate cyclase/phosphodiesterase [Candidatus Acididesulfobacter diazotrophicus]|uniref:Bifunctional diguanylate cyclase/phosphodiesterase n=1 Tax=Candidatus Acididesulfobacter diazotrophicus TaxID=2597226 RepID=A0A519BPG8_9DELT|nr:MAG: bifunctional diguanylate cyclase/phosphodiesterase [Candidatus Acididesulfobacter diazotrophicus]
MKSNTPDNNNSDNKFTFNFFKFRRLDKFILCIAISVSILVAVLSAVLLSSFSDKIINTGTRITSSYIAHETFNAMFQVMKRGWNEKQVIGFINALKKSSNSEKMINVVIFRGNIVSKQFGKISQPKENSVVKKSFLTGLPSYKKINGLSVYAYPLKDKKSCLKCHTMAKAGDVNGVTEVSFNPAYLTQKFKNYYYALLLLIFLLPITGGAFVAFIVRKSVENGIDSINKEVEKINTVRDLTMLESNLIDLKFDEFNSVYKGIRRLSSKLREVAIDKDILEFETKLLERFIITSEVVRDWKEHVFNLLIEMNNIIKVYNVFSIFVQDEDLIELEVFWRGEPSEKTKKMFDEMINKSIYYDNSNIFLKDIKNIIITHNIADKKIKLAELTAEDILLRTKKVILDAPHIGGIVGIGVQSEESLDSTRELVINSVLTTLLNVIGSIKAIYKYTKDLEYYATRDGLTGLYNQRVFNEFLHYETERANRNNSIFSLLFIDLDNFKFVNDMYGHNFGDKMLQNIGEVLNKLKRSEDILARYGGDEFAIILPGAGIEQAYMIAERIREKIGLMQIDGPEHKKYIRITVSIGVASYPMSAGTEKDIFMLTDNMMYKAKAKGKDQVYAAQEEDMIAMYHEVREKSNIVIDALNKNDVIIPYFQPIIGLKDSKILANELLMRINYEGTMLSAGEFIEVAEAIGVAHKLDLMLMEKAFKMMRESDFKGFLFVNLSPKSLIISEFIKNVKDIILKYDINPDKIVFELTERETIKNITLLEKFVTNLKYEGFRFAVDDFGSGFSSFLYIKHFPVDFIKIDGEFIRSIMSDKIDRAFVVSSVSIAKEVGIKTIAEFIETDEILQEIKKLGVDYGQGFFLAKPAPELKS